ncbi:MAG: hypothetical protein M0Q41_13385 [Bacteroidales bacterium]|nr:hypothetical protein [Bacteroidales bacterium]
MKIETKGAIKIPMYVNRTKLKAAMILENLDTEYMMKLLNISITSYYNRIKGKWQFTEREIKILFDRFGDTIFFH